jgi:exopolysaccharide biosynthesis protein
MLENRPRTLLRALIATAALALAAPSFAGAADQLSLIDTTEQVGPGISLSHQKFLDPSGWYDTQVLTVDLANGAVKSDLLTAPKVAQGEPLTTMANRVGAAAGVNGDFFDIDSTQASTGGEVQAGNLIKSPSYGGWAHVGVSKAGIGQLVDMTLQATATLNGVAQPILTINAANASGVPANSMVAYTSAWGDAIRSRGTAGVANVAEVLVTDDKVVQVNSTVGKGAIPEGSYYLVGRDTAATAIKALKVGDPVTLSYGLKDAAAQQMQWAIGTNKPLVTNGVALAQGDVSVAPRTAIGFKDGGKTMFLLITDGRQTAAALGTTLKQTADMLVALGADTGLNLDGGGSTTLVHRRHLLNRPYSTQDQPAPASRPVVSALAFEPTGSE